MLALVFTYFILEEWVAYNTIGLSFVNDFLSSSLYTFYWCSQQDNAPCSPDNNISLLKDYLERINLMGEIFIPWSPEQYSDTLHFGKDFVNFELSTNKNYMFSYQVLLFANLNI